MQGYLRYELLSPVNSIHDRYLESHFCGGLFDHWLLSATKYCGSRRRIDLVSYVWLEPFETLPLGSKQRFLLAMPHRPSLLHLHEYGYTIGTHLIGHGYNADMSILDQLDSLLHAWWANHWPRNHKYDRVLYGRNRDSFKLWPLLSNDFSWSEWDLH